jgi:hypothetical protein
MRTLSQTSGEKTLWLSYLNSNKRKLQLNTRTLSHSRCTAYSVRRPTWCYEVANIARVALLDAVLIQLGMQKALET